MPRGPDLWGVRLVGGAHAFPHLPPLLSHRELCPGTAPAHLPASTQSITAWQGMTGSILTLTLDAFSFLCSHIWFSLPKNFYFSVCLCPIFVLWLLIIIINHFFFSSSLSHSCALLCRCLSYAVLPSSSILLQRWMWPCSFGDSFIHYGVPLLLQHHLRKLLPCGLEFRSSTSLLKWLLDPTLFNWYGISQNQVSSVKQESHVIAYRLLRLFFKTTLLCRRMCWDGGLLKRRRRSVCYPGQMVPVCSRILHEETGTWSRRRATWITRRQDRLVRWLLPGTAQLYLEAV